MEIEQFIEILTASITPTILISGLGLILLSMTNRLSRPIDRIRILADKYKNTHEANKNNLKKQMLVLQKRCQILQQSILCIITSIFLVSVIILMIFLSKEFDLMLIPYMKASFISSIGLTIAGLMLFLWDIRLSLHSIIIEINDTFNQS